MRGKETYREIYYLNKAGMNGDAAQHGNLTDGFSVEEAATYLLKKSAWRINTNVGTAIYNEPYSTPNILASQIATDPIPLTPPEDNDFTVIDLDNPDSKFLTDFGITKEDLPQFYTYVNGLNQFSVTRSTTYTYIYKITKCLLSPIPSNPNYAFGGSTSVSHVNLLTSVIPFYYGEGAWKGTIYRTMAGSELSRGGMDAVKESQVANMFDYDSGVFTLYDPDSMRFTPNPITSATPPAVTCYVYKGRFGNFTGDFENVWKTQGTTAYYKDGSVSIGSDSVPDPSIILYVAGKGSITNVLTQSLETYSDRRLKENIVLYPVNKDILSLNTYTYNYKSKPEDTDIGVIAQEVETIAPHIVKEHGGMKTVQYDRFGVLLLPIVKEQQERIERLEEELYAFKSLLAKLST